MATPSEQKINDKLVIFTTENIGNGAYGAVYKGKFCGKPCALKMLHLFVTQMQSNLPVGEGTEAESQALADECDRLKSFQHDNVVQHISTEKHSLSNNIILVTELMDCSLKTYFSMFEGQSLTASGEASLCKDIASGLAYIHSRHIIHRDLCDDNVLLKLCEPVPVAKISDFGMAKLLDSASSSAFTRLGNRSGYLPPEASKGKYDQSLDVFSLGVIMMQIICRLKTVRTAEDRCCQVAQIPGTNTLKPLIIKCLQEDSNRRPSSKHIRKCLLRISEWLHQTERITVLLNFIELLYLMVNFHLTNVQVMCLRESKGQKWIFLKERFQRCPLVIILFAIICIIIIAC